MTIFARLPVCATVLLTSTFACVSAGATDYKNELWVGAYLVDRFEGTMSVAERESGFGAAVRLNDTLDMEEDSSILKIDGRFHFNQNHSLTYSVYRIGSQGSVELNRDINWVNTAGDEITIPVGAQVDSDLTYTTAQIGYLWSFYKTDKVELNAGGGLHISQIEFAINGEGIYTGAQAEKIETTLPLPVASIGFRYNITENWRWFYNLSAFALSFDNLSGVYTDNRLGMDYFFTPNIGVGAGIGTNTIRLREDTANYKLEFENRMTGAFVQLVARF
ncbi:DUF481 domain-containing protein [Gilvimarinus sp. SDUM040013]|uniref:DUF481 domain-containing protein n=1 Tax=Gilvimarinus gilvus TaxID=3058038 RepID=A0ABU4S1H5_9GAMM|nr:DUF481 domain-containing protein [Gilvimarinus sp. SDUM040013]MDO3385367.1 DUF481 domain-containing protein [Gilvimarinus sp. SDUM040013]MDX6850942.1 DUF481 domain-containing protein [Gilvimarinus sp. SDUM040013]